MFFMRTTLLLLAALGATPAQASAVNLNTESYPPFTFADPVNGDAEGASVAKVREIMRRADEQYSIKVVPWPRAIGVAMADRNSCVFLTARTPERETQFKWVGPIMRNSMAVFGRANDVSQPQSLDDIRSKRIGTKRRDANSEYLSASGFDIDVADLDAQNPRKLLARRFDFWATSEYVGQEILKQQGLTKEISPLFVYKQMDMYLACNIHMDQVKIDRWNRILNEMNNLPARGKR